MICIQCGNELEEGKHVHIVVEELSYMAGGMAHCKETHESQTLHIDCAKEFLDYV